MIPVKLSVRNFMPYRDNVPPLDFTGMHTASISGNNGNGKSALIDAITWALWGKTRAKSDDDLIHMGQNDMEVEFDFSIGENLYRVIRKRAKPKSRRGQGQSSLEFQAADGNGFKPITGNTIRETEQKIRDTLQMDYDTFINSAFLRQGHADEFTQQPPVKRKEVLANILGLTLYDELEDRARELVRKQETDKAFTENAIRELKNELERKPEYEAELKQAQAELEIIDAALKERQAGLNELRQKKELMETRQAQLTQLEKHLAESERTLGLLETQLSQLNSRIEGYETLIARRSEIEEKYTEYINAKKLNDELDQKFRMVVSLNERKNRLERTIDQASQTLLQEHALAENKILELEEKHNRLPQLKDERVKAQADLVGLSGDEETLRKKKQAGQELRTLIHGFNSDITRLEKEIEEIGEKLNLLANQTGAVCPLCERELGEDHKKLIEEKYAEEKQQKGASLDSIRKQLAQKEAEIKEADNEVSLLETNLNRGKTQSQNRVSLLEREIEEVEKDSTRLEEEKKKLADIQERLARKDFAAGEQEALNQLEVEFGRLDYDAQKHEQIRTELSGLAGYEEPKRRLEEADRLIDSEKESALKAEQAAQEIRQSSETDRQQRDKLYKELESTPDVSAELDRAESEYRELSAKQKQAQETVGGIRANLERLSELETRVKEREKLLDQASGEERIYRDLMQAFGKKGIQAWLIEMVLPELEIEANKLLGRMTDNRMNVKIETQRETKKGDTVETLDIKIADELGTRDYEMFSGGEAFRINFAIRIALSKLLARRAGAPPLQTLIVDEGFGTQDNTGLEKLKEAITSIQDDFEKIIVITHIEELRDAFPTRIDIVKTADGSTIEVS
ncbi:AAA family ATPase [Chloroflexota bacterium]